MGLTMLFYPSKVYNGTEQYPYYPERITKRVMVNPKYKIKRLLPNTHVLCDSGAFQDLDSNTRLTPKQSLDRQLTYREHLRKITNDPLFNYEAVSIYDQMAGVDEELVCIGGCMQKRKVRGSEETAKAAIIETLDAANYYATQRNAIGTSIIWIAQGVTPRQYTQECTIPLLELAQSHDMFGFGGFCIIGRKRKTMLPLFYETVDMVLPLVKHKGLSRVHVFGVCIPEAIEYLEQASQRYGIVASTDSSAPELSAVAFGKMYKPNGRPLDPKGIMRTFNRKSWVKWQDYNPIKLAHSNVFTYNKYAQGLSQ
jgi:hypothetical protein